MIQYSDLVEYIKRNHINWNKDLFEVLRGFFEEYSSPPIPPSDTPIQRELILPKEEFKEPENGEYTSDDLLNLFNT